MKVCRKEATVSEVEVSIGLSHRVLWIRVVYESSRVVRVVIEERFLQWDDSKGLFAEGVYSRIAKKAISFDRDTGLPVTMEIDGQQKAFPVSEIKEVKHLLALVEKWVKLEGSTLDVEADIKNGLRQIPSDMD